MEGLRQRRGSPDYRAATGVMRSILVEVVNESYEIELSRLSVPVTMLWGAEDNEVPVEVAHKAHDILAGEGRASVHLEVVEGVGHHLPLEAPDLLEASIRSILR